MFLRLVRARSAEQSGIKGVKRPFDPNIISFGTERCILRSWTERRLCLFADSEEGVIRNE